MKSIETERLVLRMWKEDDYLDLFAFASDPQVGKNTGSSTLKTVEDAKRIIKNFIASARSYAIVLKSEEKVIGSIGFDDAAPDEALRQLRQLYVGFSINPNYWGNGYATEAVENFIVFLNSEFDLDMIWSSHFSFNERSQRVLAKCGFEYRFTREKSVKALDNAVISELFYHLCNPNKQSNRT